jgi:hypothetical protein
LIPPGTRGLNPCVEKGFYISPHFLFTPTFIVSKYGTNSETGFKYVLCLHKKCHKICNTFFGASIKDRKYFFSERKELLHAHIILVDFKR